MALAAPAALSAQVERASALLATSPTEAQRLAAAILLSAPKDPRALLVLASAKRRLGDPAAGRAILAPLTRTFPNAAHARYELGACLVALGEVTAGLAALRRAVSLKPDLAEAWRLLGDTLFREGDEPGAEAAFAEHARAAVRDPALRPAADAVFSRRFDEAETLLRRHLASRPGDFAALRMLGEVFVAGQRDEDAEALLARCLEIDPNDDGARFLYATALLRQQKAAATLSEIDRLLSRRPGEPAYLNLRAAALGLMGEEAAVIAIHEGLLAAFPAQPKIWLNYAQALKTVGRRDEAVAAFRRCITLAPGFGEAWWGLANLKVAAFSPDDEAEMQSRLAGPERAPGDRLHLHYSLGKALEDRGAYAESFRHYAAGAALRLAEAPYDAEENTERMRRGKALLTADFFAARAGGGAPPGDPIFIVGLPRAGSTLIEQILASHSAVEGAMELPDIRWIARRLGRPEDHPAVLATLDPASREALGQGYLESTRLYRKQGRPFFVDKMPNNFHHLGLIQLILPNARIIDARRHPMASCFSAFKQHFAQGQRFSYDLGDLGRYYRDYVELMAHFDAVLPGRVHRVIYEDMVEDTETQVRRLLDYCGLPFEPACLRFHENSRAVRTVSSEQVRRPIFREGLDQWRHYEPWLEPLREALGPALKAWR